MLSSTFSICTREAERDVRLRGRGVESYLARATSSAASSQRRSVCALRVVSAVFGFDVSVKRGIGEVLLAAAALVHSALRVVLGAALRLGALEVLAVAVERG